MGRLGFEPRANRLKAEYSTIELATLENLRLSPFVLTDINHSIASEKRSQSQEINVFSFANTAFCSVGESQE